jgi:hypothetical protein
MTKPLHPDRCGRGHDLHRPGAVYLYPDAPRQKWRCRKCVVEAAKAGGAARKAKMGIPLDLSVMRTEEIMRLTLLREIAMPWEREAIQDQIRRLEAVQI